MVVLVACILTVLRVTSVLGTKRANALTLLLRISISIGSDVAAAAGIIPVLDLLTRM